MAQTRLQQVLTWAAKVSLVAALYLGFGRLSLLLAEPPGFASPVWPSAGVALAGILVFGYRSWPGIVLGSLGVNASVILVSEGALRLDNLAISLGIGLGAGLQAVLAAYLIRRRVGFPVPPDRPLGLLVGTVIAGPLGCVVSATNGVLLLLATGRLTPEQAPANWTTWWLGDTLGALLVFPVVAAWVAKLRYTHVRTRLLVGTPLVVGTALVVALFLDARQTEQDNAAAEFERRSALMSRTLQKGGETSLAVLRSVTSLFARSAKVDRATFREFARPLLQHNPGLYGLSWNVRVSFAQREAFEEAARREGIEDFEITEQAADGAIHGAPSRDDYVVVYFLEPEAVNRRALGFDLASDPTRGNVLARVRDSGRILSTPPIRLLRDDVGPLTIELVAPVYLPAAPTHPDARRERLHSYVSAIFLGEEWVADALGRFDSEGIACRVVDSTQPGRPRPFYPDPFARSTFTTGPGPPAGGPGPEGLGWTTAFELAGRRWVVDFWPTERYKSASLTGRPTALLVGGLFFASMLAAVLLVLAGRSATIERIVDERTGELSRINASLNREVRERARAEEALRRVHRQREQDHREFSYNIVDAQEEERRTLAQELHDGVAQELAAVSILAQLEASKYDGEIADGFEQLHSTVALIVAELRRLSYGLHPLELEQRGLGGAIVELIRRAQAVSPRSSFHFAEGGKPAAALGPKRELGVYRTVQESVSNALRHARARNVWVTKFSTAAELVVTIRDDGVGFDPDQRSAGMGLRSMRQRAAVLHGTLTVHSGEGGTLITLAVPIRATGDPAPAP